MNQRTCDGCTECCKGWLHGNALGHSFYPGRPCFYLKKDGCSVYEDRPEDPCKTYKCVWLAKNDLPMWMRPDLSGAVVTEREKDNVVFYEIRECGKKLDSAVLSWFVLWALNTKSNILYQIDGGFNKLGSTEFLNLVI